MIKMDLQLFAEDGTLLQSEHLFELDVSENETEDYQRLGAGLTDFESDMNEQVEDDNYLDGDGYGESDVVGAQMVLSFSGHRKYGDPVQDFIFALVLKIGKARKRKFRWTLPTGDAFEGTVTVANISGPSGESAAKGDISFDLKFNKKPVFVEYTPPVG